MKNLTNRQIINLKKKYDNDGFIKIKNFLSKKEIGEIKSSLFTFIKKKSKNLSGRDVSFVKNSKTINF